MTADGLRCPPTWTMPFVVTALLIITGGVSRRVAAQEHEYVPANDGVRRSAPLVHGLAEREAPLAEMITRVYDVADLVVPMQVTGRTVDLSGGERRMAFVRPVDVARFGANGAVGRAIPPAVLGQFKLSPERRPDFTPLVDVIAEKISPESWQDAGGPGVIQTSERNRALMITQTQHAHDAIADLLEQLRRVLDVQVVIESRYLAAPHDIFEAVGRKIEFRKGVQRPQTSVGIDQEGEERIGVDTDLAFTQGGLPDDLAEIDFAVLPPQQMKALLQVAHDDVRTRLFEAPRITLLEGQKVSLGPASMGGTHRRDVVNTADAWLCVEATVANDRRNVCLEVRPRITHAAFDRVAKPESLPNSVVAASADLPRHPSPKPDAPMVRATIPGGCTLVVDGGALHTAGRSGQAVGKWLLVLVTPRIVVREDELDP